MVLSKARAARMLHTAAPISHVHGLCTCICICMFTWMQYTPNSYTRLHVRAHVKKTPAKELPNLCHCSSSCSICAWMYYKFVLSVYMLSKIIITELNHSAENKQNPWRILNRLTHMTHTISWDTHTISWDTHNIMIHTHLTVGQLAAYAGWPEECVVSMCSDCCVYIYVRLRVCTNVRHHLFYSQILCGDSDTWRSMYGVICVHTYSHPMEDIFIHTHVSYSLNYVLIFMHICMRKYMHILTGNFEEDSETRHPSLDGVVSCTHSNGPANWKVYVVTLFRG